MIFKIYSQQVRVEEMEVIIKSQPYGHLFYFSLFLPYRIFSVIVNHRDKLETVHSVIPR